MPRSMRRPMIEEMPAGERGSNSRAKRPESAAIVVSVRSALIEIGFGARPVGQVRAALARCPISRQVSADRRSRMTGGGAARRMGERQRRAVAFVASSITAPSRNARALRPRCLDSAGAPQATSMPFEPQRRCAATCRACVGIDQRGREAAHEAERRLARVRDSAQARRDCRPRGSADCHRVRRMRDLLGRRAASVNFSTGPSREHPDIGRLHALAHRDCARIGLVGDAAEAAGHDVPRRPGSRPHRRAARRAAARACLRPSAACRRKTHDFLADIIDAALARYQRTSRALASSASSAPMHGCLLRRKAGHLIAEGAGDSELVEHAQHVVASRAGGRTTRSRCSAATARRRSGAGARRGRKREQRARFEQRPSPACWRRDAAGADRVDQAGHAEVRGGH